MDLAAELQLVPEVEVETVGSSVSHLRSPRVVLLPRQRSMQRKSPRMMLSPRMAVFRSPLSRMVLSPMMHPRVRSPSSSQGGSTINGSRGMLAEIDLFTLLFCLLI